MGGAPPPLKRFIWDIQSMIELADSEREILLIGSDLMARLLASDDWLPDQFATPDSARHQQFALYADVLERFSVVVTVLAGGQIAPVIRDAAWEITGVLRGAANLERFDRNPDGRQAPRDSATLLAQGDVRAWPTDRPDALRLSNAHRSAISIVLHVHGRDLARIGPTIDERRESRVYANPEDAPPYDIFSIQTRLEN